MERQNEVLSVFLPDSGVNKGGKGGGAQPPNELKDHPCEEVKSKLKLRGGGGDDYV